MAEKLSVSVFWFRRDLRLHDNAGLYHALKSGHPVLCIFIFDTHILSKLEDETDQRVHFIWQEVRRIKNELEEMGSSLQIFHDTPLKVFKQLVQNYEVNKVFANRDYEPYATNRDKSVYEFLKKKNIDFKGYKDQVIFDRSEVVKDDGDPYLVYTPYMKKYKEKLNSFYLKSYPTKKYKRHFLETTAFDFPTLKSLGFKAVNFDFPSREFNEGIIRDYHKTRDIPAREDGTTRLSLHLRFGTISIRQLAWVGKDINTKFFNELIWRDFYQMILYHFPETLEKSFKAKYDRIDWENDEKHFKSWCEGKTGYPIVDAGMRQLNESGYMHNRVRMVVASFLTKHLLIDWRWGEAYFAEKLLDYEQASNVGGWQWAAGSGVDAAPYFRVFNPHLQFEKFDKNQEYVKRWVPEFDTEDYPEPIVEHKWARERALEKYKKAVG